MRSEYQARAERIPEFHSGSINLRHRQSPTRLLPMGKHSTKERAALALAGSIV
jgi:hypothetical protein